MMMGTALRAFAHPTDFLQRLGLLASELLLDQGRGAEQVCRVVAALSLARERGVRNLSLSSVPPRTENRNKSFSPNGGWGEGRLDKDFSPEC